MNGIPIQLINRLGKVSTDPLYEYLLQLQQICIQGGTIKDRYNRVKIFAEKKVYLTNHPTLTLP